MSVQHKKSEETQIQERMEEAYTRLVTQSRVFNFTSLSRFGKPQIILLVGILVSLLSGTLGAFVLFAKKIQDTEDINKTFLVIIQSVGMIGLYFTIPAGWVNDRYGPFVTSMGGSLLTLGGYTLMSFSGAGKWWMLGLGFTVAGFGSGAVFMAILATVIKSNPNHTGTGVALVGSAMSLSMAFTSLLVIAYTKASGCAAESCWRHYLLFIGIVCGAVMIPGSFAVKLHPTPAEEEEMANAEASRLIAEEEALEEDRRSRGGGSQVGSATPSQPLAIGAPGGTPLLSSSAMPFNSPPSHSVLSNSPWQPGGTPPLDSSFNQPEGPASRSPSVGSAKPFLKDTGRSATTPLLSGERGDSTPRPRPVLSRAETNPALPRPASTLKRTETTHSLLQSVMVFKHPYFWVLFLGYFAQIGSGVVTITDFSLWAHVAPNANYGTIFTISFSIVNCSGTLLAGWLSDFLLKKRGTPRSDVLAGFGVYGGVNMIAMGALLCFKQIYTSTTLHVLLLVLCINAGVSFGASFSLFPSLCSEIYGSQNFGKYFGFLQIGSSSSLLLPLAVHIVQDKWNYYASFFVLGAIQFIAGLLSLIPVTDYIGPDYEKN